MNGCQRKAEEGKKRLQKYRGCPCSLCGSYTKFPVRPSSRDFQGDNTDSARRTPSTPINCIHESGPVVARSWLQALEGSLSSLWSQISLPILPNITLRRTLNQIETSAYCNISSAGLANRLSASTCPGYQANLLQRILDYKPHIPYAWIELNQGQTECFAGVRGCFSQAVAECLQGLVIMTGQIPLPQLQSPRVEFRPHLDFFSRGMIIEKEQGWFYNPVVYRRVTLI